MDKERKNIWLVVLILAVVSICVIGWNAVTSARRQPAASNVAVAEDESVTNVTEDEQVTGSADVYVTIDPTDPDKCPMGYVGVLMLEHGSGDGTYFTVFALNGEMDKENEDVFMVKPVRDGESTFKAKITKSDVEDWKSEVVEDKWFEITGKVRYDAEADTIWLDDAHLTRVLDLGNGDMAFQAGRSEYEHRFDVE